MEGKKPRRTIGNGWVGLGCVLCKVEKPSNSKGPEEGGVLRKGIQAEGTAQVQGGMKTKCPCPQGTSSRGLEVEQSPEVEFMLNRLGTKLALRESNCGLPGLGRHRRSQFRSPVLCVNVGLRLFVPKEVVCLFILNLNWEGKSSNLWVNHFCLGKLVTPATANPMPCKAGCSMYVCVCERVHTRAGREQCITPSPAGLLGQKFADLVKFRRRGVPGDGPGPELKVLASVGSCGGERSFRCHQAQWGQRRREHWAGLSCQQ